MTNFIADCGHEIIPSDDGIAANYAIDANTKTLCYECAYIAERVAMTMTDDYVAYLNADNSNVVTWTGRSLGSVTKVTKSEDAQKTYVRVRDLEGKDWYGTGPLDSGSYVRLHRTKG